jgi:hypothetical protein
MDLTGSTAIANYLSDIIGVLWRSSIIRSNTLLAIANTLQICFIGTNYRIRIVLSWK